MPAWKPSCLRPSNDCYPTAKETDLDEQRSFITDQSQTFGLTTIELYRRDVSSGLGVVVTGGADHNELPRISQIRPGSVADRSDVLQCGDYLVAINDVPTARLNHEEIINLLRQAGQHLRLEIKYPLPPMPSSRNCLQRETTITIPKENDSFGLSIRRGQRGSDERGTPFIVTRVRPGSPADRDGLIRVGDRITAVDGSPVDGMSDTEMNSVLRRATLSTRLTLQYDVQIIDAVVHASGPLYVEIDRAGARMGTGRPLGMQIVVNSWNANERFLQIESIVGGSIADRCGALNVGDRILSIEGTPCDNMTIPEAIQLLEATHSPTVNMLILPASVMKRETDPLAATSLSSSSNNARPPHQSNGSVNSTLTRNPPLYSNPLITRNVATAGGSLKRNLAHRGPSPPPLPRLPETLYSVAGSTSTTAKENVYQQTRPVKTLYQPISHPARKNSDAASSNGSLYEKPNFGDSENEGHSFLVTIERRRHEPWGIGFAYRRSDGLSDIVLQNLEVGGVAHRTEALRAGDVVVAINGRPMRNQNLGDAYFHLNSYDIATLKILRKVDSRQDARHSPAESANSNSNSNASVDSAVESWDSVRPVVAQNNLHSFRANDYNNSRPHKMLPHSVSAHHVAEVESVALRIRGSESIPERLDYDLKPNYRDAENLKNSVEMMDQILSLNSAMSEKRAHGNIRPAIQRPFHNQNQAFVLDSLLEDLASMRTQTPPSGTRRVKFQTPNGHVSAPAPATNSLGKSKLFEISLAKDPYYEDFGFSLSDGAFEKGVFVNRIRPGGPAEAAGLKTCDQLLKVNNKDVRELDCCSAVPFIASSGDDIAMLVSRRNLNKRFFKTSDNDDQTRLNNDVDVLESDML